LGDPDASVRSEAARSLGANVDRATDDALVRPIVVALIVRLSDPVDDVRSAAAWALGAIGPRAKDAVVPLTQLTKDANAQLSQAATTSLAAINDKTRD
jgi:HEAT repeat protein